MRLFRSKKKKKLQKLDADQQNEYLELVETYRHPAAGTLRDVPLDNLLHVLTFLDRLHLARMSRRCGVWSFLIAQHCLVSAQDLRCYVTKRTFRQDLLGVGIEVEYRDNGTIADLSTDFDLISQVCMVACVGGPLRCRF